jgi:uncharacterized protein (DUF885 family)
LTVLMWAWLVALVAIAVSKIAQGADAVARGTATAVPAMVTAQTMTRAHAVLWRLFNDSDEAALRRNPLSAMQRGDMRYADRLGNTFTDAAYAAERAAAENDLQRLMAIDRGDLSPTDRIAFDSFKYQIEMTLRGLSPGILPVTSVLPTTHLFGIHTIYPEMTASGDQIPFRTLVDYENGLKRHREYVEIIDTVTARFRQGKDAGILATTLDISYIIGQLNGLLATGPDDSLLFAPLKKMPGQIAKTDGERLTSQYRAVIANGIFPAYTRLRDFLRNDYLPVARKNIGIFSMKGGYSLYRYNVAQSTTLPITPEEIHKIGMAEVTRIRRALDEVRVEVGFKGTVAQFFEYVRTDPKFRPASRAAYAAGFEKIAADVRARLPEYFQVLPKTRLVVRPFEPYREKFGGLGLFQPPLPGGSQPGVFYFNASDLSSRSIPEMTTLSMHEGAPGHYLQYSLAQENEALPRFLRFGANAAYSEGWALYAETLGYDMGLYRDPYQRLGTLSDEMLRALRLVADTGIHLKGWSREQSVAFMLANSPLSRSGAEFEVERYITWPGEGESYKVGAMTIQRLRDKAKAALGSRFDIREFHTQVLMSGVVPMAVLERKIDDWIASKGKSGG